MSLTFLSPHTVKCLATSSIHKKKTAHKERNSMKAKWNCVRLVQKITYATFSVTDYFFLWMRFNGRIEWRKASYDVNYPSQILEGDENFGSWVKWNCKKKKTTARLQGIVQDWWPLQVSHMQWENYQVKSVYTKWLVTSTFAPFSYSHIQSQHSATKIIEVNRH